MLRRISSFRGLRFYSGRPAITSLSDEENMLRESVRRFAVETVSPLVLSMDKEASMHPSVIKGCFEQGIYMYIQYGLNYVFVFVCVFLCVCVCVYVLLCIQVL